MIIIILVLFILNILNILKNKNNNNESFSYMNYGGYHLGALSSIDTPFMFLSKNNLEWIGEYNMCEECKKRRKYRENDENYGCECKERKNTML